MGDAVRLKLSISGMTCSGCARKIENTLKLTDGVSDAKVSLQGTYAEIAYDPSVISAEKLILLVKGLGYDAKESSPNAGVQKDLIKVAGAALAIVAAYFLIDKVGILGVFTAVPLAKQGMGYGMLFIIGLLTSVHCVAMCGGINLTQTLSAKSSPDTRKTAAASLTPSLLYNAGRVASYTIIGAIVGAAGSVISLSAAFKGAIQLIAGVFMVLMGLSMLNIIPSLSKLIPRLPSSLAGRIVEKSAGKGPFIVGLLNGLMPCGPLQAMQLYALSTGSPVAGALSMLVFSLGTVPLMFGLGVLGSLLSRKSARGLIAAGAVLVVLLGVLMFGNGLSLTGYTAPELPKEKPVGTFAVISGGLQVVTTRLGSNSYEPIIVQKGIPVRWIIQARPQDINGCNNRLVVPSYKLEKAFAPGDNIIEFTPSKSGVIPFSCWMGMIRSRITVVDELSSYQTVPTGTKEQVDTPTEDTAPAAVPSCCL